jgi:hypothetical protein
MENQHLRSLLNIHVENQNLDVISQGIKELTEQIQKQSEQEVNDSIESEINMQLLTYEQEIQRTQEDYLMTLREEQDLQFNREIDEHKEIIQKIYDDKLQEKSDEIE